MGCSSIRRELTALIEYLAGQKFDLTPSSDVLFTGMYGQPGSWSHERWAQPPFTIGLLAAFDLTPLALQCGHNPPRRSEMEILGAGAGWTVIIVWMASVAAIATAALLFGCAIAETCANPAAVARRQQATLNEAGNAGRTPGASETYQITA